MKKIILILLLVCLFSPVILLFSCGNSGETNNNGTIIDGGNEPDAGTALQNEPDEERLYANVPTVDYGGYEFKILTFADPNNPLHDHPDLTWHEEYMGEILNDAVYTRNMAIKERFNIKLTEIHSTDSANDLRKAVTTQSDMYDLAGQRMVIAYTPITNGYYMNLHSMPNLDLTKPWYIQDSVKNLTVRGKLFTVYSEMLISPYCATAVYVFNKKLHHDYGLPDPYQMVKDGAWTFEALYDMCKTGSRDLNGDGVMTYHDDQWGFASTNDVMGGALIGGGGSMGAFHADGSFGFTLANEKNISIMDKAFRLIYDKNISVNTHAVSDHGQSDVQVALNKLWTEGRGLFAMTRIVNIRMWREMDIPFGILPTPKYDSAQENYRNNVTPWIAMGIGIPVTATDIDRTTIILEAMSAESRYTVQPAYFEITLKMKQARDDESAEMLEYIFGNAIIDSAIAFNFGQIFEHFANMSHTYNSDIQSLCDKYLPPAEKSVEKFLDFIDSLDN